MANAGDDRPVLASLLDRLTDDEPDRAQEVPMTGRRLDRLFREAIRRDIEWFLNTRRRCVPVPEELAEARGTIVDYGIPDFAGHALGAERRRRRFLQRLAELLQAQEPRFKSVQVELAPGVDESDRSLDFRIRAVVHAEPAPESLAFDSRVEPVSRTFRIKA